ncbi:hypothetical protein Y600_5797 [Burkholderia pseudomallei MSHR3709]|nr:hypothetical protein Y600_5797 [Burkholderia pseudomallei MSHR3709]
MTTVKRRFSTFPTVDEPGAHARVRHASSMHGQGERNEDRTILEGTDGYFADGRTLVARPAGRAGRARVRRAGADAVRPRRRNGPRHDGRRLRARNDGRLRNGARHDARGWNGPGHDDGFRGCRAASI